MKEKTTLYVLKHKGILMNFISVVDYEELKQQLKEFQNRQPQSQDM